MAIGLSNRRDRDGRIAGDHETTTDPTTGASAADAPVRATTDTDRDGYGRHADPRTERVDPSAGVDGVRGATAPHQRRATGTPVPPGGAVAPVPPGGAVAPVPPGGAVAAVPPGGAVVTAAPAERTQRMDPDQEPVLLERGRTAIADRDRTEPVRTDAVEPARRAHTSITATVSLIVGVTATLAALSGRLAPVAVAAGVLGLLLAAAALTAVSRRHVTGHHVALLGLAFSIAGVVFGILAISRAVPWLDGGADQAAALRDWLDARLPWLSHW
ncbi:hypothetical protein ACNTMW_03710 [Planosporangium sp. 12N6]|uniref:hypothetical protein n=1 Tax=Planosporangium spinosum TaxID=3402278 RepID=UPI003CF4251F